MWLPYFIATSTPKKIEKWNPPRIVVKYCSIFLWVTMPHSDFHGLSCWILGYLGLEALLKATSLWLPIEKVGAGDLTSKASLCRTYMYMWYIYIYICICTLYIYVCVGVSYIYIYVYSMCVCMLYYVRVYIYTYLYTYPYTCIYIYTYIYIYIYIYCIYIYMCVRVKIYSII